MSELFTVFFSWQSDTKRRHNRDLIREALETAADAISEDSSNSYRLLIQSDTEGEPGLCNIPETILRRLRESDAVVSDLTFVAKTDADDPKSCSNPNVLFELGYAFASIGPERMICVMNEAHGPAANQIFDLAHHRRPIAFTSPNLDKTRKQTVSELAKAMEEALRGVLKLGLVGGYGGDDEVFHQRHLAEIRNTFLSTEVYQADFPRFDFVFRPKLFRAKRWPDAGQLEQLVRDIGPVTNRSRRFPPQQVGTAPMDFGIYNDTYGDPWALTYAGQFWAEFMVGGRTEFRLSERDASVSPETPSDLLLPEGAWVSADQFLLELLNLFRLACNFSERIGDAELMQFEFSARNIRGRWLRFENGNSMGPCRAPTLNREISTTASNFRENWMDYFASMGKDFLDLFCRDGRVLSLDDIKSF